MREMDKEQTPQITNEVMCDRLRYAILLERQSLCCIEVLMSQAKTERERHKIAEIREDEVRHEQHFLALYQELSGNNERPPDVKFVCPSSYLEGLRREIEQQQGAGDFYLKSGDTASEERVKTCFYRIAQDEQQHSVWFLYFYTLYK
ncbi:ferritin family protein [Sporolactobacillus kofuensis]|uniref:Ferritin family protein n=1 Tax=Sporolactobacillus kofuensis TaxID=269672 RepID=A0ABW1WF99_9BACL|nr:ferritin family protein [Sporolactobacillus kofuensis]MCO7176163.1 rubrerythrin family protein [Sporolactobacillus kofuensis]